MTVKTIGLDIAKHVFQVHGADKNGRAILKKRLRREQLAEFFGSIQKCAVAMEATRGAHYWARVITAFGHEVKLIAPQFVKPYVRGQKNDMQDAAAICEAASRPEMRFVPQKSIAQQDMQMLHLSEAGWWPTAPKWETGSAGSWPSTASSCRCI